MTAPTPLMYGRQTWQHFIGGYYSDTGRFVREAQRIGISRRAPAQAVRGMQFGDRLILLRYEGKGRAFAFAEAIITGMTLDHEIAAAVGAELQRRGLASFQEGGGSIERDCGSYFIVGTWTVNCSWSDVMDIALDVAKAKGETLFVMVNARLRCAYDPITYLDPAPKFTRGFTRAPDDDEWQPWTADRADGAVLAIRGYQKAPKRLPAPAQ